MSDRYAVIGNPVAHSLSPDIHAAFAQATGEALTYEHLLAPLDAFALTLAKFRDEGGRGANVTLPFKEQAFRMASKRSSRADNAGAVNTLQWTDGGWYGDNTDGAGLVADLRSNLQLSIAGRQVLIVGAGGAARGVLHPLLAQQPHSLVIANRTLTKAQELATPDGVSAASFEQLAGRSFDIVINATSAGLDGEMPALPPGLFSADALAYDMVYGKASAPFLSWAASQGARRTSDGLGMLIEQAAEAFLLWRGIRPDTAAVLAMLRSRQAPAC